MKLSTLLLSSLCVVDAKRDQSLLEQNLLLRQKGYTTGGNLKPKVSTSDHFKGDLIPYQYTIRPKHFVVACNKIESLSSLVPSHTLVVFLVLVEFETSVKNALCHCSNND